VTAVSGPERPGGAAVAPVEGSLDAGVEARQAAADRVTAFRACLTSDAAFRRFYDEALGRVYGYLVSRCQGDRVLAEDLTQAAFGEAVRNRAAYDGRSDPVTWLIGIARHKLVDHFRELERQERRQMRLVVTELALDRDGEAWHAIDERERLLDGLGRLTAMQRAVLILHYVDGLPVREVAAVIGKSESATESLLTRGREALRATYEEAGDD
jgi:RNA polymerase sigma-70 factor (ECF subfamily)